MASVTSEMKLDMDLGECPVPSCVRYMGRREYVCRSRCVSIQCAAHITLFPSHLFLPPP
jgi:hypothetical protein